MSIEQLTEYGNELVEAGFEVWLTKGYSNHGGYLQYRDPATGYCGSLQYSDSLPGWWHLMPIVPSQEAGSSMFIEHPYPAWTLAAARQCAREANYNPIVGKRTNAGDKTWRSADAVALHAS